jgi:hypothetical protein
VPTNLIPVVAPVVAPPVSSGGAQANQWLEIAKLCVIFAGGYFSHWLLLRRDVAARKRELDLAASDFEVCINKWLDRIADRREQMALPSTHAKSIQEIEPVMRTVRRHLSTAVKSKFDDAWKNYQNIDRQRLEPIQKLDPITKCTVPVYDDARKLLSEPLQRILEAIRDT